MISEESDLNSYQQEEGKEHNSRRDFNQGNAQTKQGYTNQSRNPSNINFSDDFNPYLHTHGLGKKASADFENQFKHTNSVGENEMN